MKRLYGVPSLFLQSSWPVWTLALSRPQRLRRDYEERAIVREKAIQIFNSYSERLYNVPGKLLIDVAPTGFRFDVEISHPLTGFIVRYRGLLSPR